MNKIAILAALAGMWSGCANYNKPVAPPPPLTGAQGNFEAVWTASQKVLRDYRFDIATESRRDGTIVTSPLVGKQALEFWRKDAVTASELAENTLQTIYRTATVTIRPSDDNPDTYVASVSVEITRSDKPAVTVTSASEAYGLFTITGERNPWLKDFGRAENETKDARTERKSPIQGLRAGEGQPTTVSGPTSERWKMSLGRDGPLERQIASEIAFAATRKQDAVR
jgi:hypothetical protein